MEFQWNYSEVLILQRNKIVMQRLNRFKELLHMYNNKTLQHSNYRYIS